MENNMQVAFKDPLLLKWWKLLFVSHRNLSPFWRYLNFCSEIFGHVEKLLDKNAKVNFKINDITNWETNNYNTHIVFYLRKSRQCEEEIWSVNRIWHEKRGLELISLPHSVWSLKEKYFSRYILITGQF